MTARRAVALGYDVVLASDAHTTTDNSFLSAQQSIAYYNLMLDGFGAEDGFGNGEHEIVTSPASRSTSRTPALRDGSSAALASLLRDR